ncbi:MAG: hypothetical protein K2M54_09490 [Muribaculaceae bacterium]|nr:hypothetical protein [Muribaculaceae bacterium]
MTRSCECNRLTIMIGAADTARADIALTPERIYYRFATDESIEDGGLPGSKDDFGKLTSDLLVAATAGESERPLADGVKVTVFVDNHLSDIKFSEESLRRLVHSLRHVAEEFAFLGGFVR